MSRLLFDSTNPFDIPLTAAMVGGYVDGIFGPNHAAYGQPGWDAAGWARFPNAVHVRIACFATTNDGHVLDVETGDATPGQAPHWALMRRAAGVDPTVYVNRSNMATTLAAFDQQGVARPHIWLSTLDNSQPWAPSIVAIQYAGSNLSGGHYDLSAVADYWPGVDRPGSTAGSEVIVPQEDVMSIEQARAIAECLLLLALPTMTYQQATTNPPAGYTNIRDGIANALMPGSGKDAALIVAQFRDGLPKMSSGAPLGHAHKIIEGVTGPAE